VTNRQSVLGLTSVLILAMLAWACWRSQIVKLAKKTTLRTHQPLIIQSPVPLRVVGSTNELCLEILPPDSLRWPPVNGEWGVRRLDGRFVEVGAALLHADNSVDTISSVGYSLGTPQCLRIGPSIHDSLRPPLCSRPNYGYRQSYRVQDHVEQLDGGMSSRPNQRMKLSWRGGRLKGNGPILMAAAAPRSLCAIR
jgi:hypothetical protein